VSIIFFLFFQVKKLSGWRRRSEPGFYRADQPDEKSNSSSTEDKHFGSISSSQPSNSTLASTESIGEEEILENMESPALEEERRESIEEIVGQIVMQNIEFQRIMKKQRLVHLRRALHRHLPHHGADSGSDTETEENCKPNDPIPDPILNNESEPQETEYDGHVAPNVPKNVQRTVSDPGNKSPRRFATPNSTGPVVYDPLSLLWSSFRRQKNHKVPSEPKTKRNIRHTHSFSCSREGDTNNTNIDTNIKSPHGDSGVFASDSSNSSSEANIPTLPAVWLKQQEEHLATPNNKSGSLPRSFQVGVAASSTPIDYKARNLNGKEQRPFTIASDKPSAADMGNFDYNFESREEVNGDWHPDHKIYYKENSNKSSIKSMLLSMSQRLATMMAGSSRLAMDTPLSSRKNGVMGVSKTHRRSLKQKMRHMMNKEPSCDSDSENCESVASIATNSSSSGFCSLNGSENSSCSKIGARLAAANNADDYIRCTPSRCESAMSVASSGGPGNLNLDGKNDPKQKMAMNDLILSYIDQHEDSKNSRESVIGDSECMSNFYERSFEAIENLLEAEIDSAIYSEDTCSISTDLSSHVADDSKIGEEPGLRMNTIVAELAARLSNSMGLVEEEKELRRCSRLVRSSMILEKLKHLEACCYNSEDKEQNASSPCFEGMKSIQERRKELDMWKINRRTEDESETSSQHSTSTINTVIEMSPNSSKGGRMFNGRRCSDTDSNSSSGGNSPATERAVSRNSGGDNKILEEDVQLPNKGWVKMVVGKLQGVDN